jgi:hypothetical protein
MSDKEIIEKELGFYWEPNLGEWFKTTISGSLVLYTSINSSTLYDLFYEDDACFFYPIEKRVPLYSIKDSLKQWERDIKLGELLGNKEHPFSYIKKKSLI